MAEDNSKPWTLSSTLIGLQNKKEVLILFESGASSSFICTNLITGLNLRPNETKRRVVEQMFGRVVKDAQILKLPSTFLYLIFYLTVSFKENGMNIYNTLQDIGKNWWTLMHEKYLTETDTGY